MLGADLRRLTSVLQLLLVMSFDANASARCEERAWPERFTAQVVRVKDGDSLVVRNPGFPGTAERTLRLHGIDAPELDQPYGRAARDWLRARVRGQRLAFEVLATDRYCRLIVRAALPGQSSDALNLALLEAGLAWADDRFSDARYARPTFGRRGATRPVGRSSPSAARALAAGEGGADGTHAKVSAPTLLSAAPTSPLRLAAQGETRSWPLRRLRRGERDHGLPFAREGEVARERRRGCVTKQVTRSPRP
ncbi:MAG: thermonuclease family protein [Casimicrobiaceae bacterium]|nr:thermonuclease family protein [Casimicrobiaceae bacterium]